MKRYTKDDVEFHEERYYGPQFPAINVKVYHFPDIDQVEDEFNCSEEIAEQALQYAFEAAQETFWNETAQEIADDTFEYKVEVYSAGRSAGWLIVQGLEEFESWDAVQLAKWRSFENKIKETIKYLCSWDNVKEDISANRWAEDGAEQYNFYQYSSGESACLVDLKNAIPADTRKALSI